MKLYINSSCELEEIAEKRGYRKLKRVFPGLNIRSGICLIRTSLMVLSLKAFWMRMMSINEG
jgi:hypothetical protein